MLVVGAENARTGKTMAEKMIKIMEERLKEKAAVTDKLLSKNHALKVCRGFLLMTFNSYYNEVACTQTHERHSQIVHGNWLSVARD